MTSNKTIGFLLALTITTALNVSAATCYDRDGYPYECGVVRGTVRAADDVATGALDVLTLGGTRRAREDREYNRRNNPRNRNYNDDRDYRD